MANLSSDFDNVLASRARARETAQVYFYDELPKFGCGWRIVEVTSKGPKWVRLLYEPRTISGVTTRIATVGRLKRAVWDGMTKREIDHAE